MDKVTWHTVLWSCDIQYYGHVTYSIVVMYQGHVTFTCIIIQRQKLLKKESDVGMLLTGKQSTACRDGAHWYTKHRNKLHVGCHHKEQWDETTQQSLALHQWTRQQSPIVCLLSTSYWCRGLLCSFIPLLFMMTFYMQLVSVLCKPVTTIPTCSLFLCFVCQWAASLHCFLFFWVLVLVSILFCDMYIVQAQLHRQSMHDK